MGKFSDKIGSFNTKVEKRYRAVARTAVQKTAELAERVEKKGGTMRVDTGFLRASIQGRVNAMPLGPTTNEGKEKHAIGSIAAGEPVVVTLLRWEPISKQIMFVGWTANYARHREYKDGFLRTAVGMWDVTVKQSVREIQASGL